MVRTVEIEVVREKKSLQETPEWYEPFLIVFELLLCVERSPIALTSPAHCAQSFSPLPKEVTNRELQKNGNKRLVQILR